MYAKLRLPPYIRSFSTCSCRQTAILEGSDGRIEPNYFLYRDVNFLAEKSRVFLVPLSAYGFSWLPQAEQTKKRSIFTKKVWKSKIVIFPEIVISGIPSSRVRRLGSHVVTDFLFYGFFK